MKALAQALAKVVPKEFNGTVIRYIQHGIDALSIKGSLLSGGRWNPSNEFGAIYTSLTNETVHGEIERYCKRRGLNVTDMPTMDIANIMVKLHKVLDLTDSGVLKQLGLTREKLIGEKWEMTQEIAQIVFKLGFEAILAPSAASHGVNLIIYQKHLLKESKIKEVKRRPLIL
jgi:RES domain-containing protein